MRGFYLLCLMTFFLLLSRVIPNIVIVFNSFNFFSNEGLYKDAADCRLVLCDLKYNAGVLSLTDLVKLGEALEAAKQYKKAAGVYLDCANGTFGRNPSYPEEMVRGFAALSFKRAMDYVSAEQEYVGALRAAGSDWKSLNDDSVRNNNLNNMMVSHRYKDLCCFLFIHPCVGLMTKSHFILLHRSFMRLPTVLLSLV